MEPKAMFNIFGSFSNFPPNMKGSEEENVFSRTSYTGKRPNSKLEDLQIFTDHLKLTDRFKRTLYYGKLPATECPSLPLTDVTLELFTKTVPNGGLDILDMHYASSVSKKACISPCSMILAMMYLEQLRLKNPEYLQNVSSCDLFLISMLVASKYLYDNGEDDEVFNMEWASSANIDVKELNILEREFLNALVIFPFLKMTKKYPGISFKKWEIYVKPSTFFAILQDIECQIALREASKRGWFTYADLCVLSEGFSSLSILSMLVDNFVKVMVISIVAYIASALTLLGASAVSQKSIIPVKTILQSVLLTSDADIYPFSLSKSILISSDSEIQTSLSVSNRFLSYVSDSTCAEEDCPVSAKNGTFPQAHQVFHKVDSKFCTSSCTKDQFKNNCVCEMRVKMIKMEVFFNGPFDTYYRKVFHKTRECCDKIGNGRPILSHAFISSEAWWFFNSECDSQISSNLDVGYLLRSCQNFAEVSLQA